MALDNKNYVPTLAIRASEMNGLEFLPGATKDRMTPCFLLAPWANSSSLEKALERVERAFPKRAYFLDIDRDYQFTDTESPTQQQLIDLLDNTNCYANWLKFVQKHEHIWPCIQYDGLNEAQIKQQIEAIQKLGRPYCLRVNRESFPKNINEIVSAFAASGTADFAIIVDGGWTSDPLTLAGWFAGFVSASLQSIDATVPTVLSCTSMPKEFSSFSGTTRVAFTNRQLVEQVAKMSNRTNVIYGDWGSTRPRVESGFANRPLDRIDYPLNDSWYIFRNKQKNWTFQDAAKELIEKSGVWDGNLDIWGELMIKQTLVNEEIGINTPQKNVAARVNIHLHRQAFYGVDNISGINFDEPWQD